MHINNVFLFVQVRKKSVLLRNGIVHFLVSHILYRPAKTLKSSVSITDALHYQLPCLHSLS